MRFAVAALCVLALTGTAIAGGLSPERRKECQSVPAWAKREPTIPYKILRVPYAKVQALCDDGRGPYFPTAACEGKSNIGHLIVIDKALRGADYDCALTYEKSHLPPNNWVNPVWERSLVMRR